ncbi:hypothetical protein GCM10022394_18390 [Zobellella aerophila]|uniref:Uncharacterized protein n=1 Tax=Zobellella aerophila TaxID=870480 RepID=A0ABP6VQ70_9GAMM
MVQGGAQRGGGREMLAWDSGSAGYRYHCKLAGDSSNGCDIPVSMWEDGLGFNEIF